MKSGFIRLTPDRQSKRGTLWTRESLGDLKEFAATLTFRISGQGKKLYGDGIALWLTQFTRQQQGEVHGIDGSFVGVGVVIDTFKNAEHGKNHRDVTILVNDGESSVALSTDEGADEPTGCNVGEMRYHEDRDDFSVANMSRLRLLWANDRLLVEVDANSMNNWELCATVTGLNAKLPKGFLKKARFGISGTTGQLADNHDVISFQVHDNHSEGKVAAVQQHEELQNADELQRLVLDLEHQLESITEKIQNTIAKLQGQEAKVEDRVKVLEESLMDGLQSKLEKRITNLERQFDRKLQRQVSKSESGLKGELDSLKEYAEGMGDQGGWKTPFVVLILIVICALGYGYKHYQYLRKSHLL